MAMVISPETIAALRGKDVAQLGGVSTSLADMKAPAAAAYPASQITAKPKIPEKEDRKMEVLVLHGRQSNENLVSFQANALKGVIGKECNLTYLEGDAVWEYTPAHDLHDADDMSRSLSKGKPFYTWFHIATDDPRPRPYMWKFFDPKVKISYSDDAEKAVDKLIEKVSDGSFDCVLGIFEGSIVVHMAVAKLLEQGKEIPWKLTVCLGAMPIRDEKYIRALKTQKANHPAVLVFGKTDQDYHYSRTDQSGVKPPEDYYSTVTVLESLQGHALPNAPPRSTEIYERILAELRYYSGMGPQPPKLPIPPRPTSFAMLNLAGMLPKPIKVLSLCGGHACTTLNKIQVATFKNQLGPVAEWEFLEGFKVWEWYDGEPTPSDNEKMIAGNKPLKNWYLDKAHEGPGRLNRDKQFDPSIDVEYYDMEEAFQKFEAHLEESGYPDVIVAFSQGCIFLHMFIGHMRKRQLVDPPSMNHEETHELRVKHKWCNAEELPWRMSVFVAGMHVRDRRWQHLVETPTKAKHPTVFIQGKNDAYYDYARDGFGSRPAEEYYEDPIVLTHEQDHEYPSTQPRAREIYGTVIDQIYHHCGGNLAADGAPAAKSGGAGGKVDLRTFLGPPPRA